MTDAEVRLWARLRAGRFCQVKFRRQVPIGPYIADFACLEARLVVELDGEQHGFDSNLVRDRHRDAFIRAQGFTTMRFWNSEIGGRIDAVLDEIFAALADAGLNLQTSALTGNPVDPSPGLRPPSPARGEGAVAPNRLTTGSELPAPSPSPLVGEGGRRPGEGSIVQTADDRDSHP
ncbi:MAG: endonuclease domain-containing protein [Ancalomicrobiaceae bacterium]|nr:endonuclease domain-containing protein [Ancalomicrobiaceae bacterium]